NTYTATDANVQVSDLLLGNTPSTANVTFPTAQAVTITGPPAVTNYDGAALVANSAYTGLSAVPSGSALSGAALLSGSQSLSAGQRALITYTVRVAYATPGRVPTGPQNNTAYATSTSAGPNQGYTLSASDVLLTPANLVANDASTNSAAFAALRSGSSGTPAATDAPAPTPVTFAPSISGTVFEDVNYGGGLGRSLATSQGAPRSGATVELYAGSGSSATYVSAATTAANGSYGFTSLTPGSSYVVRVVNGTVTSSRSTTSAAGVVGVQTYRTSADATTGTVADPNRVGGEAPALVDAGAVATVGTALSTLTTATTTAESLASVTLPSSNAAAADVDFGFNFDTVVNTNDVAVSGTNAQGSLLQFISNSNALGNERTLAQVYTPSAGSPTALPTGLETSIFMIPNGTAVPGQLASLPNQFTTNGSNGQAAFIKLTSALDAVTGPATALDGSTQTRSTGDTNPTAATAGAQSTGPEVLLNLNGQSGLQLSGNNEQLLSLGLYNSPVDGQGVAVGTSSAAATGIVLRNNTLYDNGANVLLNANSTATITNNIIRHSTRTTTNGSGNASAGDGISLQGGNNNLTISGNQILNNSAFGLSFAGASTGSVIAGNTIAGNGAGYATFTATAHVAGVSLRGAGSHNNTFSGNTLTGNAGAGIVALAGTQGNVFTQNSFAGNGTLRGSQGLGIDLTGPASAAASTEDGDGVTLNDTNDADAATAPDGANGLSNFPILQTVTLQGSTLTVTGYARPNTQVELYLATPDATGFGEGTTYLTSFAQANTPGTSNGVATGAASTYAGPINGLSQGTDNTNTFTFTYTVSDAQQALLQASGATLTATATLTTNANGNYGTSEFSGGAPVTMTPLPVELVAFAVQPTATRDAQLNWLTASELHNDHFDVERSLDGRTFGKVGQVAGQGSQLAASAYRFTDAGIGSRVASGQVVHYRLRQVDLAGTSTYSPVRSVSFGPVAPASVALYPNPAILATGLDLSALPAGGTYRVLLLDATGRPVHQATLAGGLVQSLSLDKLAAGTYQVLVSGQRADGISFRQVLRLSKN
ncbi:MAG: hypothetical protein EOO36_01490, partial [Cytophagaceae bacterium]